MRRLRNATLFGLAVLCRVALQGQPVPGGEEVLRKVEAGFTEVDDYTVTLDIVADIERVKVPPMKVAMAFKKPDRVHFTSTGFAMLPKESIGFTPSQLLRRVEPERVTSDTMNGRPMLEVQVKLRNDQTGLRRLILTVDPDRWTVERLTTPQFDGRTVTALFQYDRFGSTWLPVRLEVTFVIPQQDTLQPPSSPPSQAPPGMSPRSGKITISYSDYRINKGIDDSVFEEEE